jgi:hypothetical protein
VTFLGSAGPCRVEAVAFALADISDAMNNLISGHGEHRL